MARCYRTVSTDALTVVTHTCPLHIQLQYEAAKTNILRLHPSAQMQTDDADIQVQRKVPRWIIHPAKEPTLSSLVPLPISDTQVISIYTDGSKTPKGVGAAFCAMRGDSFFFQTSFSLENFNSVYQAELEAISQAITWIALNHSSTSFHLFTDSLSSLTALSSNRTNNQQILNIKVKLQSLLQPFKLSYIKAHVGHIGNELADTLAKQGAERSQVDVHLPAPASYAKNFLRQLQLKSWESYWSESDKGRYTYHLLPNIKSFTTLLSPAISAFLTGHGPFPSYLYRFHRHPNGECECGEEGTPEHYFFECSLTQHFHLKRPAIAHIAAWTVSVVSHSTSRQKLHSIFDLLMSLS